jgi:hypothetical protein
MDAERKAEIRTRCDPSQRQPCRAYLEDVPDLLAAIDELEVRNAKLEAVAYLREHGFPNAERRALAGSGTGEQFVQLIGEDS